MTVSWRYRCPKCGEHSWKVNSDDSLDYDYECHNDSCGAKFDQLEDSIDDAGRTFPLREYLRLIIWDIDPAPAMDYIVMEEMGISPKTLAKLRGCSPPEITENMMDTRCRLQRVAPEDLDQV